MLLIFFDTYTDWPQKENYDVTALNLQTELSKGYAFVDITTHGGQTQMNMESGPYYTTADGEQLVNSNHTIITTSACDTNAFDTLVSSKESDNMPYDPCLSESLIRNSKSGVIGYLGSSRSGINSTNGDVYLSSKLNALFYKYLFSSEIPNKNFAAITSAAKARMLPTYGQCLEAERWIQYATNPIGDPEMPVYTTTPQEFPNVEIIQYHNRTLVRTGVNNFKVCMMTIEDNGKQFYKVKESFDTDSIIFNGTTLGHEGIIAPNQLNKFSICITKQNYRPEIIEMYPDLYFQNETITPNRLYFGNNIYIGSSVMHGVQEGDVTIDGDVRIFGNKIVINKGTNITANSSFSISTKLP